MTLPLPLDHLVYAVPDLGEAIDGFERRLGVRATYGGRHDGVGSHNAILPMDGETYVELIALDPENPSPPLPPPFGLATLEEARLTTWAVRSSDIEADVERARAQGADPGVVFPASRVTAEGERLEWKLTLQPNAIGEGTIPFVIDWGDAPHPARSSEREGPRCRLRALHAVHPEPAPIRKALEALGAELEVRAGEAPGMCAEIEGPAGAMTLR